MLETDKAAYTGGYSTFLSTPGNVAARDSLDLFSADLDDACKARNYEIRQPNIPTAPLNRDVAAQTSKERSRYLEEMQKVMKKLKDPMDKKVRKLFKSEGVKYKRGKYKTVTRVLEKARLCYDQDLRRITDFERRSMVCETFEQMESLLRDLNQLLTLIRVKNRFAKSNKHAKATAGYRDLQVLAYLPGTTFIVEFQFHLRPLFDIKSSTIDTQDATGKTGHERYVEFREIKEGLKMVYPELNYLWD